tara:strand:- start:4842 stop:5168 length:327 start_codon:yes stop_codon:yes gene_type:complete
MSSLNNAFKAALSLAASDYTWERPGEAEAPVIKVAKSNYSRNLQGPEEIVMSGREFVLEKTQMESSSLYPPKRGDRLIDQINNVYSMIEINPMTGLKGELIGFRVRVD